MLSSTRLTAFFIIPRNTWIENKKALISFTFNINFASTPVPDELDYTFQA